MLKKYIVALVMALNILLCRFMDALMQTDTKVADLIKVASIMANVKTAKTTTQVCRDIDHHNSVGVSTLVVDVPWSTVGNVPLSTIVVNVLLSV